MQACYNQRLIDSTQTHRKVSLGFHCRAVPTQRGADATRCGRNEVPTQRENRAAKPALSAGGMHDALADGQAAVLGGNAGARPNGGGFGRCRSVLTEGSAAGAGIAGLRSRTA